MKDYSKYIPNSFGFITKLAIVGDEVHVWTPESKKREPHKFPLEELTRYQKRLEKQYKLIIENKESIKEDYMENAKKKIMQAELAVTFPITLAIIIVSMMNLTISPLFAISALLIASGFLANKKISKNFDAEMQTYETYLKERKILETLSKEDKNITDTLNRQTTNRIKANEELQQQGIIQEVFNIEFMDRTSLKQLRKILRMYQISKSLQERQVFVNPNEIESQEETKEKPKRLKRDPRR